MTARSRKGKAVAPPPRAVSDSRANVRPWLLLALVTIAALSYSNSLESPFLLDDQSSIVDNTTIRRLWPLTEVLRTPRQFPTAGRPVINLSLAVNYALGGLSPVGYHIWNLVVHILCGLLLFGIIRRTLEVYWADLKVRTTTDSATGVVRAFRPAVIAFACALIWLVHPLQTEVIDYVTQRTESMMALFYLLTLYCAIRGFSSAAGRVRWYILSVFACSIGMACKESMVTAPLMVLLYDRVFTSGSFRKALDEHRWLYAGLISSWIVLIALNAPGPRFRSAGFSSGISPWTYLLNQAVLICRYLTLTIWPHGLVVDYGVPRNLDLGDVWPFALVIAALIAATGAMWRRHPQVAFLGLWFFITLAPSSSIVPIATEVGAERRMYLPLAALVTLIVCASYYWSTRLAERAAPTRQVSLLFSAALAVMSGLLIVLTVQRNAEYRARPIALWQTVLDRYPHARAHYNLGVLLRDQGRREEALREYQIALPEMPEVEYALGFELVEEGKYADAVVHLRRYIQLKPEDANVVRAYTLLGRSLAATGAFDEAIDSFRRVLQMQPRNVDALGGLADGLLQQQRLAEAITAYQDYVRLAAPNASAYFNLGLALGRQRRDSEAVTAFTSAVALSPRDPAYRANLASGLVATGRVPEAIEEYRRAAELEPDPETRAELARIIQQLTLQERTVP